MFDGRIRDRINDSQHFDPHDTTQIGDNSVLSTYQEQLTNNKGQRNKLTKLGRCDS